MSVVSNLFGKVVVVTGASSGIGKEISLLLGKSGCKVVISGRREQRLKEVQELIEKDGAKVLSVVADVSKKSEVFGLIEKAEKEFGPVDILINNAGVMHLTYMKNVRVDEWEEMVDINIKGVMYGIAAVLPGMLKRKCGDIVNISSDAGRKTFITGTPYCATKWAVEALTAGLRAETAGTGLRVMSIQPGATTTELGAVGTKDPQVLEEQKANPWNIKFLDAADVAQSVVFALSMPRSASINEILIRPEAQGN